MQKKKKEERNENQERKENQRMNNHQVNNCVFLGDVKIEMFQEELRQRASGLGVEKRAFHLFSYESEVTCFSPALSLSK